MRLGSWRGLESTAVVHRGLIVAITAVLAGCASPLPADVKGFAFPSVPAPQAPSGASVSAPSGRLDFGVVPPGSEGRRVLRLHNATYFAHEVPEAHVSDARFSVRTPLPLIIPALGDVDLEVIARPTDTGAVEASLSLGVVEVVVVMNRGAPCLRASTSRLDFGPFEQGCRAAELTLTLENTCAQAAVLRSVTTASPEFQVVAARQGVPLLRGESVDVLLTYRPADVGSDASRVELTFALGDQPEVSGVDLAGEGTALVTFHESVTVPSLRPPGDFVLVLDDSPGMRPMQASVVENLEWLRSELKGERLDLRLGVLTTARGGGQLRQLASGARWTDGTSPSELAELTALTFTQSSGSSCIEAITAFAQGELALFHRDGASLQFGCVTNQPDQSPLALLPALGALQSLLPRGAQVNVVARFYDEGCGGVRDSGALGVLAQFFLGATGELCDRGWQFSLRDGRNYFGGYKTRYFLTHQPDVARAPLVLHIDGALVPPGEPSAPAWSWDGTRNELFFDFLHAPPPGSVLTVDGVGSCR